MDIDIVVLWVDGSDPAWLAEKNKYSPVTIDDSNSASRFRDWGLMKYWFRAIETNAPWVRKIHFVTWGHLPPFLNTEHPKLHIVRHEDYIPREWLPTFSSHVLEMNMHRIPGLADHFIYFNDDTFLMRSMREEDFFRKGLPCQQATELPLGFMGQPEVWSFAAANDIGVINKHISKKGMRRGTVLKFFSPDYSWYDNLRSLSLKVLFPGFFTGFKNFHCPAPFLKSTFEELWVVEPKLLEATSSHRFRNKEDVNQWVAQWWQMANGRFSPRRARTCTFSISNASINDICKAIEEAKYEMISINDPEKLDNAELLGDQLRAAFENRFNKKSNFER